MEELYWKYSVHLEPNDSRGGYLAFIEMLWNIHFRNSVLSRNNMTHQSLAWKSSHDCIMRERAYISPKTHFDILTWDQYWKLVISLFISNNNIDYHLTKQPKNIIKWNISQITLTVIMSSSIFLSVMNDVSLFIDVHIIIIWALCFSSIDPPEMDSWTSVLGWCRVARHRSSPWCALHRCSYT